MRQIGRLENMAEKSGILGVRGIGSRNKYGRQMYRRITREVVEINMLSYYIVQLRVPPSIHIVAGK